MESDRYLAQHQLEEIIADAMREVRFFDSGRAVVARCCTLATEHKQSLLPQSLSELGQLRVKAFHSRR